MSSRRLQDIFKTFARRLPGRLQDVFKAFSRRVCMTSCNYVFKTSWKTKKCYTEDVLKTSSRRLQDVFSTSSPRRIFAETRRKKQCSAPFIEHPIHSLFLSKGERNLSVKLSNEVAWNRFAEVAFNWCLSWSISLHYH